MSETIDVVLIHPDPNRCVRGVTRVGIARHPAALRALMSCAFAAEPLMSPWDDVRTAPGISLRDAIHQYGYDWEATLLANEMTGAYKSYA